MNQKIFNFHSWKVLVMSLLFSGSTLAQAQESLWQTELKDPQVLSPQTADMVRFDQTKTNLNSGRLDLSIPLINFTDPDFELPISLSYNSGGFIPSTPENFVGLNWSLLAGGMIYREVKGIPDDFVRENYLINTSHSAPIKGFLNLLKDGKTYSDNAAVVQGLYSNPHNYLQYNITGNNNSMQPLTDSYSFPVLRGTNIEASSDIYRFNFDSHSGSFLINFDGTTSVVCEQGGHVLADLSLYSPEEGSGVTHSEIRMIADNGYIYCFGGSYSAMEYSATGWQDSHSGEYVYVTPYLKQINSFCLYKVIAPNGRELHIDYRNMVSSTYHQDPLRLFTDNSQTLINNRVNENYVLSGQPNAETPYTPATHNYSLNKVALINKIYTDDKEIRFFYSRPTSPTHFNTTEVPDFAKACGTQLDSICLYDTNAKKREGCQLTYTYSSGTYARRFLREVSLTKTGRYHFDYNGLPNSLPSPLTIDIDHWRYWKGSQSANTRLIPEVKETGGYHSLKLQTDEREPSGKEYDITLLSTMTLPTGGTVCIEYEPNYYRNFIDQLPSSFQPTLNSNGTNQMAGGARIRRISHYDGIPQSATLKKEVLYLYNRDKGSDMSSGILMYKPRYALTKHNQKATNPISYTTFYQYGTNGFNLSDYASDHVRYSCVTEVFNGQDIARTDSSLHVSITPLEGIRSKVVNFKVGALGDREKQARIIISGSGTGNLISTLVIKKGSNVVKEYQFDQNSHVQTEITLHPLDEFTPGDYRAYLDGEKGTYVSIKLEYPGSTTVTGFCKESHFTDYVSNPDVASDNSVLNGTWLNQLLVPVDKVYLQNFLADPISYASQRGKLADEIFYNAKGEMLRRTVYNYAKVNSLWGVYVKQAPTFKGTQFGSYTQVAKISLSPYLLTERQTYDFTDTGEIGSSTTSTYDEMGYLKKQETTTSEGKQQATHFTYAFETTGSAYNTMKQYNIYAPIVKRRNTTQSGTAVTASDTEEVKFTMGSNTKNELCLPVVSEMYCAINDTTPELRIQCQKYDTYGNLIYQVKDNLHHSVFLWGYEGKYLIAEIENATYEQVKQALGETLPESLSAATLPDMDKVNSLRRLLTDALVSTYTYLPLVGMTSSTTPNGQTTYFEYDPAGRLSDTYLLENGQKRIVNHTEYHLEND